jgi:hypothetical protein
MEFFTKISNLISNISGLDTNYLNLRDKSAIDKDISRETSGYKNICDLLSYRYFDNRNLLFLNQDNVISSLFELSPIVGVTENLTKNLEYLFDNGMPEKSHIEFLLIASTDIADNIKFWQSNKKLDSKILKRIFRERKDFLNSKCKNFKNSDFIIPRNYRIYLSYSRIADNLEYEAQKHNVFITNFMQKLTSLGLNPKLCSVNDLAMLIREILELNLATEDKNEFLYNPQMLLSDQLLRSGFNHQISKDGISHVESGLVSRLYYTGEFPKEFSLHHMIKLLGDGERDYLSIPGRFLISYVVSNDINAAHSSSITQKGRRTIDSSEQWYSRNNRDIKREATEWKDVCDRSKNGERFLTESFQIMLTTEKDFIETAEQSLLSLSNI